jgi:hypothetical protein
VADFTRCGKLGLVREEWWGGYAACEEKWDHLLRMERLGIKWWALLYICVDCYVMGHQELKSWWEPTYF